VPNPKEQIGFADLNYHEARWAALPPKSVLHLSGRQIIVKKFVRVMRTPTRADSKLQTAARTKAAQMRSE